MTEASVAERAMHRAVALARRGLGTTSPNPATAGSSVTVSYTVANQGGTAAPASHTKVQIKTAAGALLISLAAKGGVTTLIVAGVPVGVTALAMPAVTAVAMSHAPRHRIGLASGVFNASRQTGGALGVAVLGALLVGGGGYLSLHAAFLATAGAYAGGIALALTGSRRTDFKRRSGR